MYVNLSGGGGAHLVLCLCHTLLPTNGGGVLQTGVCLLVNDRVVYMLVPDTGHAFRPGSPRGTGKKSWRLRMRCLVQAQGTYVYMIYFICNLIYQIFEWFYASVCALINKWYVQRMIKSSLSFYFTHHSLIGALYQHLLLYQYL